MSLERQQAFYDSLRKALSTFIASWEDIRQLRDEFNDFGGQPFFGAFFATQPPPELTLGELYDAVVAVNLVETALNAGPRASFDKAKASA